jgi:hypothetical protein
MEVLASLIDAVMTLPAPKRAVALAVGAYYAYRAVDWLWRRLLTVAAMSPLAYGARFTAPLVRAYSFEGKAYFNSDGVSDAIALRREKGATARFFRVSFVSREAAGPDGRRDDA